MISATTLGHNEGISYYILTFLAMNCKAAVFDYFCSRLVVDYPID